MAATVAHDLGPRQAARMTEPARSFARDRLRARPRRCLPLALALLPACGAEPVTIEPDPLPEGAIQLFTRSSFDTDRGLALATDGKDFAALYTQQDQNGHKLVFARYAPERVELSRNEIGLGGSSGGAAVDLLRTEDGYLGLFVRFTEDARTFLIRYGDDGTQTGDVLPLLETPLYEPGPVRGDPKGLPRLVRHGERVILVWPGGVGSQVVLHAGVIDLTSGQVVGQRLMDTLPDAYPAPSRIIAERDRLWFAWLERPAEGRDRLRVSALDAESLNPVVSGAILGREIVGRPVASSHLIVWSGLPAAGGDAGLFATVTSSGAVDTTTRLGEVAQLSALTHSGAQTTLFSSREDKRLILTRLSESGVDLGGGQTWLRKSPILDLEATRTASAAALYWEELRSDGARLGVLRFFEGEP